MTKIYTAVQNTGISASSFKERKLANMMGAKPSDVLIFPRTSPFPRFQTIMARMHQIIDAELSRKFYTGDSGPIPVLTTISPRRWLNPPMCRIVFDSVSAEEAATLYSIGLIPDGTSSNIFTGSPNCDAYPIIKKVGPLGQTFKIGYTDFEGYLAWNVSMRAMHAFSFASQEARKIHEPAAYQIGGMVGGLYKPTEDLQVARMGAAGAVTNYKVEAGTMGIQAKSVVEVLYPNYEFKAMEFVQFEDIDGSFFRPHNLIFPYFEGLVLPDRNFCYDVLLSLFGNCLGSSPGPVLEVIRRGYASLCYQAQGRTILHAFYLMSMCSRIGGHLRFIVRHGDYLGGYISDDREMGLFHLGENISSCDGPTALMEVLSMQGHKAAIKRIVAFLDGEVGPDGKLIAATMDMCDTSRDLLILLHLHMGYINSKDGLAAKISEQVDLLTYGDVYEKVTQASIISFLNVIATGREDSLDNAPAWIMNGAWIKTGIVARALSVFGGTPPSCNYGGGSTGKVVQFIGENTIDNLLEVKDGKSLLPCIPFRPTAYASAIDQWTSMLSSGKMTLVSGRQKKKEHFNLTGTTFVQSNKEKLKEMLGLLQLCTTVMGKKGVKRGRETDAPVGARSLKKVKVVTGDF